LSASVTEAGKRFHSLMPSDGAREKGELINILLCHWLVQVVGTSRPTGPDSDYACLDINKLMYSSVWSWTWWGGCYIVCWSGCQLRFCTICVTQPGVRSV
jgi:hypothetical protein